MLFLLLWICKEEELIFVIFFRLVEWSLNWISMLLLSVKWLREYGDVGWIVLLIAECKYGYYRYCYGNFWIWYIQWLGGFFGVAWAIWYNRNKIVLESSSQVLDHIWGFAKKYILEFKSASIACSQSWTQSEGKWIAPPPGLFKINGWWCYIWKW